MVDDKPDGFCKCLRYFVEGAHTVANHIGARSLHYQEYTDDSLRLCFGHVSLAWCLDWI